MDPGLLVVGAAAAMVLLAVLCVLLVVALSGRRRLQRDLAAARAELADLGRRVQDLSTPPADAQPRPRTATEYVITTVGDPAAVPADGPGESREVEPLTAGQFASVAVGESLVRVLSFGHGVRRALSPENRNRIVFEMRREVRRSRKQRRRDLKEARRQLRASQRDGVGDGLTEDAA